MGERRSGCLIVPVGEPRAAESTNESLTHYGHMSSLLRKQEMSPSSTGHCFSKPSPPSTTTNKLHDPLVFIPRSLLPSPPLDWSELACTVPSNGTSLCKTAPTLVNSRTGHETATKRRRGSKSRRPLVGRCERRPVCCLCVYIYMCSFPFLPPWVPGPSWGLPVTRESYFLLS